jgi:flagellin
MQRFTATSLKVVTASSDAKDINNATFEIDGKKFLLVNSETTKGSFTAAQRASMSEDITLIDIAAKSIGKAATDDKFVKKIAAEISRVTGLEAKAVTSDGKDGSIKKDDTDTTAGPELKQSDIVFTKDKLKLDGNELSLQIGDTNKDYQKVNVKIQDMSSKGLGLTGLDLSNQEAAGKSVETIQDAINKVSTQRGQLGALQNRLDHTLNSLDATTQNITAAESQIRDVDMAKEMTQYSKNNILVQAAQSMLAQANSLPQGVLSLLQ